MSLTARNILARANIIFAAALFIIFAYTEELINTTLPKVEVSALLTNTQVPIPARLVLLQEYNEMLKSPALGPGTLIFVRPHVIVQPYRARIDLIFDIHYLDGQKLPEKLPSRTCTQEYRGKVRASDMPEVNGFSLEMIGQWYSKPFFTPDELLGVDVMRIFRKLMAIPCVCLILLALISSSTYNDAIGVVQLLFMLALLMWSLMHLVLHLFVGQDNLQDNFTLALVTDLLSLLDIMLLIPLHVLAEECLWDDAKQPEPEKAAREQLGN